MPEARLSSANFLFGYLPSHYPVSYVRFAGENFPGSRRFIHSLGLTKHGPGYRGLKERLGLKIIFTGTVNMESKFKVRLVVLWIILAALFWLPSLPSTQAKEVGWEHLKGQLKKINDFKELKLNPKKETALLQVEEKYSQERKSIVGDLKKHQEELKAALAAPTQDEAKIKDLVSNINAAQDKLLTSFKVERDEAMALMNPIQQGQFIMIMSRWYQEIIKK
jgi:Spy/CpxP family protein refolding chaperone